MPSDIVGTQVFDLQRAQFYLKRGPVFTNVLLADEVNRAPAKTQSALLEAMEERQVTIEGERHLLPAPFMVLATQNPVEYEGTYPLPEAQLDRFMFKIRVDYPPQEAEQEVLRRYHRGFDAHTLSESGLASVVKLDAAADNQAGDRRGARGGGDHRLHHRDRHGQPQEPRPPAGRQPAREHRSVEGIQDLGCPPGPRFRLARRRESAGRAGLPAPGYPPARI